MLIGSEKMHNIPIVPILIMGSFLLVVFLLTGMSSNAQSLNRIKNKRVGDGQHGTARFATDKEIKRTYRHIPYNPAGWREGDYTVKPSVSKRLIFKGISKIAKKEITPKRKTDERLPQGTIVGMKKSLGKTIALVDEGDVHTLMIGAAGVGKTACFIYPNLEYACASGMSFVTTDTKGDIARNYGGIAKLYDYNIAVIDLRNPTQSDSFNMLYLVNKYMDLYKKYESTDESLALAYKAKAEKYSKITAKTIINSGMDSASFGQNAFFYDAAEGLLTSVILMVSEYCDHEKRHIISVFKMIQDLLAPSPVKGKNHFQLLIEKLPSTHKARWFAGAALNTGDQAMASVLSTALSRLNAFLDSEMEQILCFDTCIDAEKFCNSRSAVFIIMPEEDNSKYFMVSLIVQQLYREMLVVADENGGKLKNRVMMYLDEVGTIPKIDSAEMMFSASRSRKISIVAIIQSLAQLEKNYGKEGSSIIIDNCQVTLFGGFAPNSQTAEVMSKNLGEQTVMSGSVTKNQKDGSQSLQMISRPLITPDELKTMPKFHFIVAKTGCNPMKTRLRLFFEWGIKFIDPYIKNTNEIREILYASKEDVMSKLTVKKEVEPPPSEPKEQTDPKKEMMDNAQKRKGRFKEDT